MTAVEDVDSRHYRFGFVANSREELPPDFDLCESRGLVSALFLPRDDAGWFGRSRYPPRMILLYDDALEIHAHPSSGEARSQIPLRELWCVELGHILLDAWLRFGSEGCDRNLPYNACSSASVHGFLAPLRRVLLPRGPGRVYLQASFGESLDLKFTNAGLHELMPDEKVLAQFFQPSRRRLTRLGPFKQESWSSADLLAITDRRAMWITDRHRERHQPYGTITRFAPLGAVSGYACIPSPTRVSLAVTLKSGLVWRFPVPGELEDEARAFVKAVRA